jgi:hypothetical protein
LRSFRLLKLRAKYQGTDKLPEVNTKIWYKEIANQKNDLDFSLKRCRVIIKILEKLQKDCARTADDLDNVLLVIKDLLKKKIEKSKVSIATLEKEAKAAKCNFWQMVFTFGAACRKARELRNKLNQ